jgi:hypothetical protein
LLLLLCAELLAAIIKIMVMALMLLPLPLPHL